LFNYEPPANGAEIRAASEQFVRKISGFNKPSVANQKAIGIAVDEVTRATSDLLYSLKTSAPPRNRVAEAAKTHAKAIRRFGV
jgi:hypothetical protein